MKSSDVRRSFIEYFADREHAHVPSAPLVPHGDATLLFTNAGMVQFKNYFVGAEKPPFERAVTAQKCMRVSGWQERGYPLDCAETEPRDRRQLTSHYRSPWQGR